MDYSQALVDLVVGTAANVISAIVMVKMVSWLDKKGAVRHITIGKWRVGDGRSVKGGWFSSAIIALAKWVLSIPD